MTSGQVDNSNGWARTRRVLHLAIPSAAEAMLGMLVGLANIYLVGHLGAASIAAVGLGWHVALSVMILFTGVGTGTTALVARMVGAGDRAGANRATMQALIVAFLVGVLATVVLFGLAEPILRLMGAEGEVLAQAVLFQQALSSVFWISAISFIGSACMRGAGDTRTPMLVMMVVTFVNIAVAWVLIEGVGPFPALGVLGAGIGSAISRSVGALLIIGLLLGGRCGLHLRWHAPDWQIIKPLLRIGLPASLDQLVHRIGMLSFVRIVASLGTASFAAHQIVINAESLSFMPGWGFAMAATTLVGQGLGAGNDGRAERDAVLTFYIAAAFMSAMGIAFLIFAPQVIGLFTDDPAVIAAGSMPLRLIGLAQPFLAAMMVFGGGLRGAGDTLTPMWINGGAIWFLRIPLSLLVTYLLGWGLTGVWMVMSFDLMVRGSLMFWQFRRGRWKAVTV